LSGTIVLRRGAVVESRHRVHVAVADPEGHLLAWAGDPGLVTHFRSAAKPLQALPLVEDGVVDAFGIPAEELALACASHNGEEGHVAGVRRLLERMGVAEEALELGPHLPCWRRRPTPSSGAEGRRFRCTTTVPESTPGCWDWPDTGGGPWRGTDFRTIRCSRG